MSNNPDIQHRLRSQLLGAIPELQDRPLTYDDLDTEHTPYLEAVIYEVLRISRMAIGVARDSESIQYLP
jgi:cytochrome P450